MNAFVRGALLAAGFLALGGTPTSAHSQGRVRVEQVLQVGDRVVLRVDGEPQLTDTFTVITGPAVVLPKIGPVPLAEVRRADVERYLAQYIGRFIREPIVHAHALIRVGVFGEVAKPGYYAVPSEALIGDVLMSAGGPTQGAKVDRMTIERSGKTLYPSDSMRSAIARGVTIAELELQPSDALMVPKASGGTENWLRILGYGSSLLVAIFAVVRLGR